MKMGGVRGVFGIQIKKVTKKIILSKNKKVDFMGVFSETTSVADFPAQILKCIHFPNFG